MKLLIVSLLTVIGLCYVHGSDRAANVLQTNDHLPYNVEVHQYDVKLTPYFNYYNYSIPEGKQGKFDGEVSIHFSIIKPCSSIELNSEVDVIKSSLFSTQAANINFKMHRNEENHTIIESEEVLKPAINYTLNFVFNGQIHKPDHGAVYSHEYVDKDGRNTALLSTHFQAIQAREAFPCLDDPFFKAIFVLSLVHPINSTAYSNAKVESVSRLNDNQAMTVFEPSVKMSTYLFAFAIGDFTETVLNSTRGVTVRSISTVDNKGRQYNSAEWAAKSLDYMENYLGIPYPLDKLDHIETINHTAGAMENFGLATYQDQLTTLIDNELLEEAENAAVVCHETAHQWFGNLVTNKRWGHEFLHEAFAVYFQYEIPKSIGPFLYHSELLQVRSAVQTPDFVDKFKHPIVDNKSYFDKVTYLAGGQLIYHIATLTGENFKKALTMYQERYAFRNAELDDLLEVFDELYGNNFLGSEKFSTVMRPSFVKPGIPEIQISLTEAGDYRVAQLSKKQNARDIPLIYYDVDTNETLYRLLPKSELISILPGDRRYLFNPAHSMYADVSIHESVWKKILVNNTFGRLSGIQQLSALEHIVRINKEMAIQVLEEHARNIKTIVYPTLPYSILGKAGFPYDITTLLEALLQKFDFAPTIENRVFAQFLLVLGVHREFPHIVNGSQKLFDEFVRDCAPGKDVSACTQIPAEFRKAVYFQGQKTESGANFLQDYEKRVESDKLAKFLAPELKRLSSVKKYGRAAPI